MKQILKITCRALYAIVPSVLLLLCHGCEDESSVETSINISPGYSELQKGESVTLSATGWDNCEWSMANSTWGVLSSKTGDSVTYTATREAGTDSASVNQTITAVPTSTGIGPTNSIPVISGSATIRHIY